MEDGRVAVGAAEPAVGDLLVGGLGEVDAVPAEVRRRVGARRRARHPAPRAVLVVELAAAGAAARLERRAEPCTHSHQKPRRGRKKKRVRPELGDRDGTGIPMVQFARVGWGSEASMAAARGHRAGAPAIAVP